MGVSRARPSRVCSIILSTLLAVLGVSVFALWFGMNSDQDNVHPLLTQLIPAGHCSCQSSTIFNCSSSDDPIYGCPITIAPSPAPPEWEYDYVRDHANWGLFPQQCHSAFPGLFEDVDRAARYWEERQGLSTGVLDAIPLRPGMARALIHDGKLYVVEAHAAQEDHRRKIVGILSSIHRALTASTPPDPSMSVNHPTLEFVFSIEDKLEDIANPRKNDPIWVLGRKTTEESVWLMPDFGFWAWENQFNQIGPFDQVVGRIVAREREIPWEKKKKQLVWRGKLSFAPKLRRALLEAARNKPWGDVKELVWKKKDNFLPMDEHCDYMFIAHVEGRAFSSSLKYRQACRSVIVSHELQYIQHHHYLLQSSGPQQNFVQVSRDFSDLEPAIEDLLANPEKARRIADKSVEVFRERYLTQAAEACYWRYLFSEYARVFNPAHPLGDCSERCGLRYESFMLLPSQDMMDFKYAD
ncbi:hypothetical protein VTO42DRAFT_4500 [Malbranchea cinnamomea]